MSDDELSREDQRLLDNLALVSDAHDEGQLEALEAAFVRAQDAQAAINTLVEDLRLRIAVLKAKRPEDS